jgi:transcription elongation factor GreA
LEEAAVWKDLISILVDEENKDAQNLDTSTRDTIQALLDEAEEDGRLEELLQTIQFQTQGEGIIPAGHALMGMVLIRLDRAMDAAPILTSLCSRLEQGKQWEPLAWVASQILAVSPTIKSARFLAKAAEEAGLEILPQASLDKAYEAFPDEHKLSYFKAQQAKAQGDEALARDYLLESLQGFLQAQHSERIEEIYLELVSSADQETIQRLFKGATRLARRNWALSESLLDLVLPQIQTQDMARESWDAFVGLLTKVSEGGGALRRFLRTLAPKAFPEVEDVDSVLMKSGLFDDETKAESAVKNLKILLGFAPGYYVLHATWNVGKIHSNDGEYLIIDFTDKPGHRMGLDLASRALNILPHDDLRVMAVSDPEGLTRIAKEEPGQVVYLALRELGGEANTTAIKKRITDGIVAPRSWTTWWKNTKAKLEEHPRVDLSLAFKNTYRVIEPGDPDQEIPLPSLDRKRGVRANLNLIRRFLEQHPGAQGQIRRIHAPILGRWVQDERTRPDDRVALHIFLEKALGIQEEGKTEAVCQALEHGLEPADIGEADHQMLVLNSGLENCESQTEAVIFGIASRHEEVRETALAKLRENPEQGRSVLQNLLRNPDRRPVSTLAVIQQSVRAQPDDALWPRPGDVAASAALLAEKTTRDTIRRQAIGLLDPNGPLADRMKAEPASESSVSRWINIIMHWRFSERALFHIYSFLEAVGLNHIVDDAKKARSDATNRALLTGMASLEIHGIPMTRATFKSMQKQREGIALSLRTEIPEAIRKAREHGDLSENAEYDAAKQKQAQLTEQLSSLNKRLQQAQIIEEIVVPEGQAGPGTEVVLEEIATGQREHHWILGEGDNHIGEDVISVLAPLGKALLGRQQGDSVNVEGSNGPKEYRIVDVRPRLP